MTGDSPVRRSALFVLLALACGAPFLGLIVLTGHVGGGKGAYATGLMWSPGVAALIACGLTGQRLESLGWRWCGRRWLALAYLLPLLYGAVAYAVLWGSGFGSAPDPAWIGWARKSFGWTDASDAVVVAGGVTLIATTGLPGALATALGEEIGWRGFLGPLLEQRFGPTGGALMTGAVWAAWHMPLLLFADYNNGTPAWYGAACFIVLVLGLSVILGWMRRCSRSVWPAAVLHASHNLFLQSIFTPLTLERKGVSEWAIGEFGFLTPSVVAIVAVAVWAYGRSRRDRPAPTLSS